jgi:hypothetical protein
MKLQKYPYKYVKNVKIIHINLNMKSGNIMLNRLKLLKIKRYNSLPSLP